MLYNLEYITFDIVTATATAAATATTATMKIYFSNKIQVHEYMNIF